MARQLLFILTCTKLFDICKLITGVANFGSAILLIGGYTVDRLPALTKRVL